MSGVSTPAVSPRGPPDPGDAAAGPVNDAEAVGLREADPATIDLSEARRIVAGGAGLGSSAVMDQLGVVALALGCALGATRVVADAGWVPFSRQIGTTGVVVDPELYLAFGISGAVQHVSGIGNPTDLVAVNTDQSCPMMGLADLAIVTDAPAMVAALARRLGWTRAGRERGVAEAFDVVVVGAGPAGSTAALVAARAGLSVCLLERGPYPGSKNMYGGVVYGRVLDRLVPRWWEEMPVQRWVTRRSTMLATADQSVTVEVRGARWGDPPYNGATAYRSELDAWLADTAVAAGAVLVTETTAVGLLRQPDGRVTGVTTDRPDGDLGAQVVIACDGANSFLAKEAGLYPRFSAHDFTLGVKEVLHLGKEEIDRRFGLVGREGLDIEMVGVTRGIPGGGFLYTNLETVAVGVVVSAQALGEAKVRPEELIAGVKRHPSIAPYLMGADLKEYSAHLIPEGGYDAMPELIADGMMVAGDAGAMCLAAGLFLEGVNFAIGSGQAAAETAVEAIGRRDTSTAGLAGYRRRMEQSFVLADHKKMRRAPELLLSERMQQRYAPLLCDVAEGLFTVTNPTPKPGLTRLLRQMKRRHQVRWRDLAKDGVTTWRTFG